MVGTDSTAASMAAPFTSVPVLPLSKARDPVTKPQFLADLKAALLNVGFLYLSDIGLPDDLIDAVCVQTLLFLRHGMVLIT